MLLKCLASSIAASLLIAGAASGTQGRCGKASFYGYGDGFHGRTAADGSRFNGYGLTTAHPWYRFGTRLLVTNPQNGKSVVVVVTDRGPYIVGRRLDLSYGAFKKIANPDRGVIRVCYKEI